jgi:hypothetical protein
MQSTGFRKMKGIKHGRNVEMPPGVSLTDTSYQDFQNIVVKWKYGVVGYNWTTYFWKHNPKDINVGMSADDVF